MNQQSHGFIDTIVQLNNFPKEKYNVLIPVTSMQVMSNMQKILVNEVSLNTDAKEGGDIYYEKSSSKYAITKVGGTKLAAAANISVVSSESETPDVCVRCMAMSKSVGKAQPCGNCPHAYDVKYVVRLRVPEPSGNFRIIEKHKEIDCVIEKAGMASDAQFNRFLPHRASITESKAFMRCLRDALGLKAGYTLDELRKPFIIAHIVPNLDAPEIRERLASSYLNSMGMLFELPADQKQIAAGPTTEPHGRPELPPVEENFNEGDAQEYYNGDDDDDGPLPWDDEKPEGIWCEGCESEIVQNGSWAPEAIKEYSEKRFNKCLCPDCQRKAKGGRK